MLLETRFLRPLMAEYHRKMVKQFAREMQQAAVVHILRTLYDEVPEELAGQVYALQDEEKLDQLIDVAIDCEDLEAFREALKAP
jgi:hypothetical protein